VDQDRQYPARMKIPHRAGRFQVVQEIQIQIQIRAENKFPLKTQESPTIPQTMTNNNEKSRNSAPALLSHERRNAGSGQWIRVNHRDMEYGVIPEF
jgi:hypothetical protein